MVKSLMLRLAAAAAVCVSLGFAQLPAEAQQAYDRAKALQTQAQAAYPKGSANIGQALWAQAIEAAQDAVDAAPGASEPLLLRAQLYTQVGFWARAEESWRAYFQAAGDSFGPARVAYAEVVFNLGYAAYQQGGREEAQRRFAQAVQYDPSNAKALSWQARVFLEQGDAQAALPLWQRVAQLEPNNAAARYFARTSAQAVRFGPQATQSFYRGYYAYEAKDYATALAQFRQAAALAPGFAEAQRWLGRTALEQNQGADAVRGFEAVVRLEGRSPANDYWLGFARDVSGFGLPAVKNFREGYRRYAAGDKAAAENLFLGATRDNPQYQKAWAWLGRARLERRDFAGAVQAYGEAVRLDPSDRNSAYFLRQAQRGVAGQ